MQLTDLETDAGGRRAYGSVAGVRRRFAPGFVGAAVRRGPAAVRRGRWPSDACVVLQACGRVHGRRAQPIPAGFEPLAGVVRGAAVGSPSQVVPGAGRGVARRPGGRRRRSRKRHRPAAFVPRTPTTPLPTTGRIDRIRPGLARVRRPTGPGAEPQDVHVCPDRDLVAGHSMVPVLSLFRLVGTVVEAVHIKRSTRFCRGKRYLSRVNRVSTGYFFL